ncbi:unnamed protein product, partial [Rotaria sordida]
MKCRPIKRELGSTQQKCVREHRFTSTIAVASTTGVASYGAPDAWCPFLRAWQETSTGTRASLIPSVCIEACAQGIVREAALDDSH